MCTYIGSDCRCLLQVGLLSLMYEDQTDFINTFRALASAEPQADSDVLPAPLQKVRTC